MTFHPGNQDVPSSIDVTIMDRSALVTPPLPYSKRAQPFRAACGDHPAAKVCRDFGAELKQCGGEDDHIYLLVVYPPKLTVSKLLTASKAYPAGCRARRGQKITGRSRDGVP